MISQIRFRILERDEFKCKNVRVPCYRLFRTTIPLVFRTEQGPTRRRMLLTNRTLEVPTNFASGKGRAFTSSDIL